MKYTLTKLSTPNSFQVQSDELYPIFQLLGTYICNGCTHDLPDDFSELSDREKVEEMLVTQCGAEFLFEIDGEE